MNITIFGTRYVGLVTGTCLAEVGNQVRCMDIDQKTIEGLNQGIIPIYEPGLEEMVKENHQAGRLRFTTEAKMAVEHGLFQFIAVGTPLIVIHNSGKTSRQGLTCHSRACV